MGWADDVADGLREGMSDAGVTIQWKGVSIPALQGTGQSFPELEDGGVIAKEDPTFTVLKSDLLTLAAGRMFSVGDIITFSGKRLRIARISFDVADPDYRLFTTGEGE